MCLPVGALLSEKFQDDCIKEKECKAVVDTQAKKKQSIEKHSKLVKSKSKVDKIDKPVFYLSKFAGKDSKTDCWRYAVEDYGAAGEKFKSVPPKPWDVKAIEKAAGRWLIKNPGAAKKDAEQEEKRVSFGQALQV